MKNPAQITPHWIYDNQFFRELPVDPEQRNFRRQVYEACSSQVHPTPAPDPHLGAFSEDAAEQIDISKEFCKTPAFIEIFSGNRVLPGMEPFAMCYGGHQFGSWAGQLGDGRAINLAEIISTKGKRWCLQLKGAGPTPYSRNADGFAVLRSSIREFLCSEAMHHLGIPTTRALSVITSGRPVVRDMFYDGHPQEEPGAIVCRLAPSFLRFGNFQIHAARGELDVLKQLVDYTLTAFFPKLGQPGPEAYIGFFAEVCHLTAQLAVDWMRTGFVHGVLNTDNMSILGLTLDYGPYGWLEDYDENWTPNTTDAHGRRYCYGNQPHICQWNLLQLANALLPLVGESRELQLVLDRFQSNFHSQWLSMMLRKIGISQPFTAADSLIDELIRILQSAETDMTIFFRNLARIDSSDPQDCPANREVFSEALYHHDHGTPYYWDRLFAWCQHYAGFLHAHAISEVERISIMNVTNPRFILRNYLVQQAIDTATQGDFSMVDTLLATARTPYIEQPSVAHLYAKRPEWARHKAGCSMLSCSS